jgi:spore coat polysaccharide biosynthesis predicted glycosyltransferase SpsG
MIYFIPDTHKKAGLGHLYRCYKYADIFSKNKKIFFIKKKFNKTFLDKNFKYIFYDNLEKELKKFKKKARVIFLDTYNEKLNTMCFKNYANKKLSILDYKTKCNSDVIIDHTFLRENKFHKKNHFKQKILIGHKFFPAKFKKYKKIKKEIILIDFGSINNKGLINQSVYFVQNISFLKKYKILIINKFYSKNNLSKFSNSKNIYCHKHVKNIYKIYKKTYLSIGACGISLYEKCFIGVPTIAIKVALNQTYNFKNFSRKKLILDYKKIINNKKYDNISITKEISSIRKNLSKKFSITNSTQTLNNKLKNILMIQ